jgi:hypothetical protein
MAMSQTSVACGPEEELASVVLTPPRELGPSGRRTLLRQAVPAPSPRLNLVTPPDHHHLALHACCASFLLSRQQPYLSP